MNTKQVVIIGGGFGGLYAAKAMGRLPLHLTLVDKRNFHLFQPLLYQVATGGLSPGDIASPLRGVVGRQKNTWVVQGEVVDIDPQSRQVILMDGVLPYDVLVVATGVRHSYFGRDEWERSAPGLKTIEDALEIRRRVFTAFERAEREPDPVRRQMWQTFVLVGAGPTGVELAGALGELANRTLRHDFKQIDPTQTRILLLEGGERVLPGYPAALSHKAAAAVTRLGVTVRTHTLVTQIGEHTVTLQQGDKVEHLEVGTILWAAGVQASPLGRVLAEKTGVELDRSGRVKVNPDLTLPDYPEIFVIGDLAHFAHQTGQPLPGVAQVAMQMGYYVAQRLKKGEAAGLRPPFRYKDKGNLAVIGRNAAVADLGWLRFSGYLAWLIWVFIHIAYLIEFDNKVKVLFEWFQDYLFRKRGARLITDE
ncbi:MAG: NAD(P)/FAD-dependent oxidoreductase [Anaerolineae bacterium]|nr:NAD(P)/FAD-dependent oxidoreductase [Anaerolineae bacterium]